MSEKIRVLIVDDLPETRENVRKLLQFESDISVIAQAGNGKEAVEMAVEHRPDIVLMDINMPGLDGIGASQAIVRAVPTTQIVIMSVQSEADYLRRAMLAGARDFLMKPFSGDELVTAIRRVHQMRPVGLSESQPAESSRERTQSGGTQPQSARLKGNVISVYSPKGGSGCTTIAINLGVALVQEGYSTLLLDGSLQFGDVAVMLDMKPTTSIVDLMERMDELDGDLISSVALRHSSGLRVLMAPPRPEMADLVDEENVRKLLGALREYYDFVVIDTSSSLNDIGLAMLDNSDRIFLVTQQSLPALKNVSRFFDLSETLNYQRSKVVLIVNRASDKLGISVKDVSDTLKRPVIATIPVDDAAVARAADQGHPLVTGRGGRRPIGKALAKLASLTVLEFESGSSVEEREERPDAGPIWRRLFSWVRQPA